MVLLLHVNLVLTVLGLECDQCWDGYWQPPARSQVSLAALHRLAFHQ